MSEKLMERMTIYDICRDFEWKHAPQIIVMVDKGAAPHRWVINMMACGFTNGGGFSKEVSRSVIFGRKDLKGQLRDVLEEMYKELYG